MLVYGELTTAHAHVAYYCKCGKFIAGCLCKDDTTKAVRVFEDQCDCKARRKVIKQHKKMTERSR